jgi:hypothetical protein
VGSASGTSFDKKVNKGQNVDNFCCKKKTNWVYVIHKECFGTTCSMEEILRSK